jgi:hypothetical protein
MEEAEALCGRIGIMVQGQIRVLGTKNHLKKKFGSGYELSVKLTNHENASSLPLEQMISENFPTAKLLSQDAGLIIFQIPQKDSKLGKAFSLIEKNKKSLFVETYAISQPTLEQVFIRTVQAHTPEHLQKDAQSRLSSLSGPYSSARRESIELRDPSLSGNNNQNLNLEDVEIDYPCRCTGTRIRRQSLVSWFLFLVLFLLVNQFPSDKAKEVAFTLVIILLFSSIVHTIVWQCAFCQGKKKKIRER